MLIIINKVNVMKEIATIEKVNNGYIVKLHSYIDKTEVFSTWKEVVKRLRLYFDEPCENRKASEKE